MGASLARRRYRLQRLFAVAARRASWRPRKYRVVKPI